MPHRLDESDQLAFVCSHFEMASCEGSAEERNRAGALVKHCTESGAQRITIDRELAAEIRQVKHRRGGQGLLERREGLFSVVGPAEAFLAQQAGEWRSEDAVVFDEAPVVAR